MAEIVGIFAASHTPVMLNFPDAIAATQRDEVFAAFSLLGVEMAALSPQAIVVLSDDHVHNFFLNNMPALCIGAAERYRAPVEHWLKAEERILPGDAQLGAYLLRHAMHNGFDPALSMELTLDHGILTPLELAGVARSVPIVPILINCVQPPLPTMRRCFDFGRWLGEAIRAYPGLERVAVLATGGISHDLATPRMGMVNESFDRAFLQHLEQGRGDAAVDYASAHVHEAGNGAEEIRMWLAAMAVAAGRPFRTRYYCALADWYTGIGIGDWNGSA